MANLERSKLECRTEAGRIQTGITPRVAATKNERNREMNIDPKALFDQKALSRLRELDDRIEDLRLAGDEGDEFETARAEQTKLRAEISEQFLPVVEQLIGAGILKAFVPQDAQPPCRLELLQSSRLPDGSILLLGMQ